MVVKLDWVCDPEICDSIGVRGGVRKLLDFARDFWNWDGWFWVKIDDFKLSENLFMVVV